MKFINRGYIKVKAKQSYIEWVNAREDEFTINSGTDSNIYLIEEEFFEIEPVLKSNFQKIFLNELQAISEEEEDYPEITLENFKEWFELEIGNTVFDCESSQLISD
jgi:hypothetical protein